ncbi:MAG: hypothetical protein H6731_03970 [Myxococcales bacterium]|nr:MAG: hypothetical protein H6731_03970 [Myxococcales bacterium]
MTIENILIFCIACGLVGVFVRRNLLNIISSILQICIGITSLTGLYQNTLTKGDETIYFILFFTFIFIIFIYSIAILLIRRRSTLQINELTEMRG